MRRGQVATEFLLVMGFVGFVLFAYLLIALTLQQDAIADEQQVAAERLAAQIRQELVTASVVMDGYRREFSIPEAVRNRPVEVLARPAAVIVRVGDQQFFMRTPAYNGSPQTGVNVLRKEDGEVFFE